MSGVRKLYLAGTRAPGQRQAERFFVLSRGACEWRKFIPCCGYAGLPGLWIRSLSCPAGGDRRRWRL